jgi:hypothetical protein
MSDQDFYDKIIEKFDKFEERMDNKLKNLPCIRHGEQIATLLAKDETRCQLADVGRKDKSNSISTIAIIISIIVAFSTIYNIFFK